MENTQNKSGQEVTIAACSPSSAPDVLGSSGKSSNEALHQNAASPIVYATLLTSTGQVVPTLVGSPKKVLEKRKGVDKKAVTTTKAMKCCIRCGATTSPKWRMGNTLCNACGLNSMKAIKREALQSKKGIAVEERTNEAKDATVNNK